MQNNSAKPTIHSGKITRLQLMLNMLIAGVYFSWWFLPGHVGNPYLYNLLLFGEIYHILLSFMFWFTIWPTDNTHPVAPYSPHFVPSVDIFITVTGEPVSVVEKTIIAAKRINYPNFKIHVLNDGWVAKKDNWNDIELLAAREGVNCITRKIPGGAKAGNINNALKLTSGEIIVVFDADMEAIPTFLQKVIPYFRREEVGFVQSPQYYKNYAKNTITAGAWEQQEFFFGPIMRGKEKSNSSFICGTNFAIRREALDQVGGMNEKNIAEDFLTSLAIHQKKWVSYYVPEVLAVGLAPEDLYSYNNQQNRWARGTLEVLFGHNPIFKRGLSFGQRIEYLSSALFYFNGLIVLIDMLMPVIYLASGIMPVAATTTSFAIFFIPFMAANLFTLYKIGDSALTFRAISFTQSSWYLQLQALFSVILRRKTAFAVTSKSGLKGDFRFLVYPHLFYIGSAFAAMFVAVFREGFSPAVITNISWVLFNCIMFLPFIFSAFKVPSESEEKTAHLIKAGLSFNP
ncbi:MAG TPA: glycosyltransferase [Candidatus Saccharimonadales bacterium]|nr:glycosyltransferase [Candidatus Saccharimonadales bacterium]